MQHQTDIFNTAKLLIKNLEGNLSETEKQRLEDWLQADPQNDLLFEKLQTDEYLRKELKLLHSFDEQKAFEKFHETFIKKTPVVPLRRNPMRRMIGAAAAVVIIAISVTIFFLNSPKQQDENIVQIKESHGSPSEKIMPGGNIATLTLSDGSVISLNHTENGVVTKEGNVDIVKLKDGQISYGKTENTSKEILYNVVATPKGGKYNLTLADGTRVWLNAASSLRFPASFSGNDRRVEMEGEVYFDIAEDLKHPFIVMVNGAEILVTGTEFNVDAYQDESSMKITLLEGKVELKDKNNQTKLTPGQQAEISEAGNFVIHNKIDMEEVIAWKEGLFYFNKADIKAVMKQISRWYDIEVEFEGKVIVERLSGKLSRNVSLNEIIQVLELYDLRIIRDGRKIVVGLKK